MKKRIIACLDIKDGRTVKGIHFEGLRDAGDPLSLARHYADQGVDELVFLDITATIEGRKTLLALVTSIASVLDIPFTVGGGIQSIEDASAIINAGADKVSINSAALQRPNLIQEIATRYGRQCVVVAIDGRWVDDDWYVFASGGRIATGHKVLEWAQTAVQLGAGEILLTSMDADGTKAGFDLAMTKAVAAAVSVPVIASGGAGNSNHFHALFTTTSASAGLAASIFHFGTLPLPTLKQALEELGVPVRILTR